MKILTAMAAAAIALSGAAYAQTTSQAAVLGASDDVVYSLQVQGANGVIYNCKPNPVTVDGSAARVCVRADSAGLFDAGAGLGSGGATAAGAVLVLLAVAGSSSPTTTTTTVN